MHGYILTPQNVGTAYPVIRLELLKKDEYGDWNGSMRIEWQASAKHPDYRWYAMNVRQGKDWKEWARMAGKLVKAGMHEAQPADFIAWLESMRGWTRLIVDPRTDSLVTLSEYEATFEDKAYKVFINGTWESMVLARDENTAKRKLIATGPVWWVESFFKAGHLELTTRSATPVETIEDIEKRVWRQG